MLWEMKKKHAIAKAKAAARARMKSRPKGTAIKANKTRIKTMMPSSASVSVVAADTMNTKLPVSVKSDEAVEMTKKEKKKKKKMMKALEKKNKTMTDANESGGEVAPVTAMAAVTNGSDDTGKADPSAEGEAATATTTEKMEEVDGGGQEAENQKKKKDKKKKKNKKEKKKKKQEEENRLMASLKTTGEEMAVKKDKKKMKKDKKIALKMKESVETQMIEKPKKKKYDFDMPDIGPEPPRYQRSHIRPVPEMYHLNYFRGTPWMKMDHEPVSMRDRFKAKKFRKEIEEKEEENPRPGLITQLTPDRPQYPWKPLKWHHAVGGEFHLPWKNIDLIDRFTRIAMRNELAKIRPELLTYDQDIQWWTETESMMREGPYNSFAWGPVSEWRPGFSIRARIDEEDLGKELGIGT